MTIIYIHRSLTITSTKGTPAMQQPNFSGAMLYIYIYIYINMYAYVFHIHIQIAYHHIHKRHPRNTAAELLGGHVKHRSHQQSARRPAIHSELRRRRQPFRVQIAGAVDEVGKRVSLGEVFTLKYNTEGVCELEKTVGWQGCVPTAINSSRNR